MASDSLCMIGETKYDSNSIRTGYVYYSNINHLNRTLSVSASIDKSRRTPDYNKDFFRTGIDFAFEILNVNRVEAEVLECNLPAQKLEIEFLGFKVEGVKRDAVYKSGKYYNSLVLGMLRSEWDRQNCNTNFDHEIATRMVNESRKKRGV
jgi:RimJ/RimL family protein N-acetyltransferase